LCALFKDVELIGFAMLRLEVPQATGQNPGMIKPLVLFTIGFLFPGIVHAQAPLQKVVVTYSSRSSASIDLLVAHERGFSREESLDPQLVQVRATAAIAAIVSGEVHAQLGAK
jgi:hypothetical protein